MVYKDFNDFLNEKFYKDEPMTLDDEWPDKFNDWLSGLDIEDVIRWADEYAKIQVEKAAKPAEGN